ncbi:MAG: hypothetical protein ACK5IM_07305 [Demequina sp.]|uniref:hypothetical protein n=1 Tax=Demequina sp. TaxID=2050685 RepID=UPI003A8C59F1
MRATEEAALIADLRHRRREMRRELARVRWWRRLVTARRDLAIAQLMDGEELGRLGLSDAWEALAADAPTVSELSDAVWPEERKSSPTSVEALAALDARLESYETRVADNLESVTAQMVRALGQAHRGQ